MKDPIVSSGLMMEDSQGGEIVPMGEPLPMPVVDPGGAKANAFEPADGLAAVPAEELLAIA
jgi:hypothetical protein